MWKNIILDWSGTMVDDLRHVWEATNHVLRSFGRETMPLEQFRREFRLPWIEYYNERLLGIERVALNKIFWEKMQSAQQSIALFPQAMDFLHWCRDHHLPLFVLSTVDAPSFRGQSDRLGVTPLLRKAYVGVEDKREAIGAILEENSLDPAETVMVGDMVHDIEAARRAGAAACAVLSGFDPREKLEKARPDLIVRDLAELRSVLIGQQADLGRLPVATVGVLIFNTDGAVLMVRTAKWSRKWGIPGGKIRYGESMVEAARREILEEVNLELEEIRFQSIEDCVHPDEFFRDAHFLLINFSARARSGEIKLNDEAQAWQWIAPEEAIKLDLNKPSRRLLEHWMRSSGVAR